MDVVARLRSIVMFLDRHVLPWLARLRLKDKFRRDQYATLDTGMIREGSQVMPLPPRILVFRPRGFGPAPDHRGNETRLKISRAAAVDLFRFYGLDWVPGEYWALFEKNSGAVGAFQHFCGEFGIDVYKIRAQQNEEMLALRQLVGMLLEIGLMRHELPHKNYARLLQALQQRAYTTAEELTGIAHTVVLVMRDAEALGGEIKFAEYGTFMQSLNGYRDDLFQLTSDDIVDARRACDDYRDAWEAFVYRTKVSGDLIDWIEQCWPEGTAWASDNEQTVNGMVVVKEETIERLLEDDTADVFAGVEELEAVHKDLLSVMNEIKNLAQDSTSYHDTLYRGTYEDRVAQWYWALEFLKFQSDATPTKKEIKEKYIPLAMKHHPDKFPYGQFPDNVIAENERIFGDVTRANEILTRGKPAQ